MNKCNGCTLCCYLDNIPELKKRGRNFCPHQQINHGCKIYPNHPKSCQDYRCVWYACNLPMELKPDISRVLFERVRGQRTCIVSMMEKEADMWKQEFPLLLMLLLLECGISIMLSSSNTEKKDDWIGISDQGYARISNELQKIYNGPIPKEKLDMIRKYRYDIEAYFI